MCGVMKLEKVEKIINEQSKNNQRKGGVRK